MAGAPAHQRRICVASRSDAKGSTCTLRVKARQNNYLQGGRRRRERQRERRQAGESVGEAKTAGEE